MNLPAFHTAAPSPFPLKLRWLLGIGLPVALVSGTFSYLLQIWINPDITLQPIGQYRWVVLYNVVAWSSWFVVVWLAAWLAWRVPIGPFDAGTHGLTGLAVHALAAVTLSSAHLLFAGSYQYLQFQISGQHTWANGQPMFWEDVVKRAFLFSFEWHFLLYWGVVVAVRAWVLRQAVQERELAASHLRAQLAEAELDALQKQLQPHFVHNALHAVSALMFRDVQAADEMIERLGRFLRAAMERDARRLASLDEELALVADYLDIQQVRFGSDLRLETRVPPALLEAEVPLLVLQPLVENAVDHGFEDTRGGTIRIEARREWERIVISVEDNGRGLRGADAVHEGIGLTNTRARLQQLYPDAGRVEIGPSTLGGARVVVSFPLRIASGALVETPREDLPRVASTRR